MYPANASGVNTGRPEVGLRHALGGLQAGVLGSLGIFVCLMAGSLWNGRSIWVVPNLFATTFYGSDVYRNQLLRTSWTGIALIVAVYGGLGALWGFIWRDERKPWLRLYGAIAGLAVYFFFYDFIWRHVNPLVTLYAPDRQLQLGHVLWGIALARSPLYARRIADSTITPSVQPVAPAVQAVVPEQVPDQIESGEVVSEEEVKSGEVIR